MEKQKTLSIYCGKSVNDRIKCSHPQVAVEEAIKILKNINSKRNRKHAIRSNHPETIYALHHYAKYYQNITLNFYLDGVELGNNISAIFTDFNCAFPLPDITPINS